MTARTYAESMLAVLSQNADPRLPGPDYLAAEGSEVVRGFRDEYAALHLTGPSGQKFLVIVEAK